MGFILSILAYILFAVVAVVNFPLVLIAHTGKHGFFRVLNRYWFENARDLDIFGNHTYRTTWNMVFSNGGYKFGRRGETISSALGKKQLEKSLSFVGWIMVVILWIIDVKYWFKGGHCVNSIQNFPYLYTMPRDFHYHEEIKILFSEVFRNGNLTDAEWNAKYEALKEKTPLEDIGNTMYFMIQNGYTLDEARETIKEMLLKAKRKQDVKDL